MSRTCKNCNHTCHCFGDSHIDEYMDYCPCNKCNCGQKEEDKTYENQVVIDDTNECESCQ
jgi:hypothetical protein